jgi:hypothetical protein
MDESSMTVREGVAAALAGRFGSGVLRAGAPGGAIAVLPARHPDVGDAIVHDAAAGPVASVTISVGQILGEAFDNFDSHLDEEARAARLANDVVRFLAELSADRLLLWRSTDGRHRGWRERGDAGHTEPLVLDNRVYERYLWSGPLPAWQAVPAILASGTIHGDREYEIVATLLSEGGPNPPGETERTLLERLATDYRRTRAV